MINKILLVFVASLTFIGLGVLGIYGLAETNIIERDYHHHHHGNSSSWEIDFSNHCMEEDNEYCSEEYSEWCLEEGEEYCFVDEFGDCFEFNEGCLEELGVCYQYE